MHIYIHMYVRWFHIKCKRLPRDGLRVDSNSADDFISWYADRNQLEILKRNFFS